jgi:hypothetical protein
MELTLAQPLPPTPPKPKCYISKSEVVPETIKARKVVPQNSLRTREGVVDMTVDNPTIQPQSIIVSFLMLIS